jgi:UDP-perosamine 4-acetyltransferase
MLTCIGSGGHARALELPPDTQYVNATPEDILEERITFQGPVVVGVGFPNMRGGEVRARICAAMSAMGYTVVSWHVGAGPVYDSNGQHIFRGVHIGPGAEIGVDVILNTRCIVEHDAKIGAGSHIAPGAIVLGAAVIGERCMVGSGAVVLHDVTVKDGTLVKAGEVRKR